MWPVLALALTTGAAPAFTNKSPTSPPAVRRSSDAALKSAVSDSLFTFGGFSGSTLSDLQVYSTSANAWTQPATLGLPARERHAMGYDPLHDIVVIVGGANGFMVFDSVYLVGPTFNVTAPPLPTPRPSARIDAALHWAPALQKFIYYGGQSNVFGTSHSADLWTLDVGDGGVTWQQLLPTGPGPTARGAVCSAVDPDRNLLVMFGGEVNGPSNSAEVWTYPFDGGSWALQMTTGIGPSARSFCAAEWEPTLNQLVVYGGQTSGPTGGLFSFDPATNVWTPYTTPINPGNLSDSAAVYSLQQKGILFFGGRSGASTYMNNTWLLRFNSAPVVDAGPNFSIGEGVMATLSGFLSDPEGDPLDAGWTQTLGPAVTLSPSLLAPAFTTPAVAVPTTLRFVLTASDGFGTTVDDVNVTILNTINEVPVANAGMDVTVDGGDTVLLVGSGMDPNGQMVSYGWSQLVGPPVTLSAPMASTTTFVAPSVPVTTVLSFRLVVNDGMAASLPDDVFVTVNSSPVVDAGVDAGIVDAGIVDAGIADAGEPDAGVDAGTASGADAGTDAGTPDAGRTDGGVGAPRQLSVSCGCSQAPATWWWAAGLLLLSWRRRRA